MSLTTLLLVLLIVVALGGGGWGLHSGAYSGGPFIGLGGLVVLILVVLLVTGRL